MLYLPVTAPVCEVTVNIFYFLVGHSLDCAYLTHCGGLVREIANRPYRVPVKMTMDEKRLR